jgi:hypothetical protein
MKVVQGTVSDSCPLESVLRLLEAVIVDGRPYYFATSVGTVSWFVLPTKRKHDYARKWPFELGDEKDEITETCVGLHVKRVKQVDFESQ